MTTEEPHEFALPPWDTVPYEIHPKQSYDKLLDILLLIPGCMSLQNKIRAIIGLNFPEELEMRLELESLSLSYSQRLDHWWGEYAQEQARLGRNAHKFGDVQASYILGSGPYYPDAFAAACTASYHAAHIIICTLLEFCSGQTIKYDAKVEYHSNHILASSLYLITNRSPSSGTLMMVFPLKIICRCSHSQQHVQLAFETLERLGHKKGLTGICTQSAPLFKIPLVLAPTMGSSATKYPYDF